MVASGTPVALGDVLLSKYRVEQILGKGGMGLVVAVRHIELDERFAMKLMLPEIAANPDAVERFLREARAAVKLKGDHVAHVLDVGRLSDGTPYMVMEYLTGADLKGIVTKHGPLPVEEAAAYVLQACDTLGEAHSLGIVHRDVKPANLFLTTKRNGAPCIKILDFGISKLTGSDATGLTVTASVGGSPLYMSPEQMRSAKHVDGRTDIWSLGIVFYELLTGTTPFAAESITAVAGRVLTEEPLPPSRVRPEVPQNIDAIVLRCLARRADERFPTMEALGAELRSALREQSPSTHPGPSAPTIPLSRGSFPSASNLLASSEASLAPPLTVAGLDQVLPGPPGSMPSQLKPFVFDSPSRAVARHTTAPFVEQTVPTRPAGWATIRAPGSENTTAGFGQSNISSSGTIRSRQSSAVARIVLVTLLLMGSLVGGYVIWLRSPDPTMAADAAVIPTEASSRLATSLAPQTPTPAGLTSATADIPVDPSSTGTAAVVSAVPPGTAPAADTPNPVPAGTASPAAQPRPSATSTGVSPGRKKRRLD